MKTLKKIILSFSLLISQLIIGQIIPGTPVNDVEANFKLNILNKNIVALLKTEGEDKINNGKNLKESIEQSKKMEKSLNQVEKIQESLKKVKNAIRDVNAVRTALMYTYKTVKDSYFILFEVNNMTYSNGKRLFESSDIQSINDSLDQVLNQMNTILSVIQKLVTDDVFKMDDGKRLELILSLNKSLKDNYDKVHAKAVIMKSDFENSIIPYLDNSNN